MGFVKGYGFFIILKFDDVTGYLSPVIPIQLSETTVETTKTQDLNYQLIY